MTQSRKFSNSSTGGFTMLEIMVVIIIIGTISALTFPRFTSGMEKIRAGEAINTLTTLLAAQQRFALENGGQFKNGTGGANNLASGDLDVDIPASGSFDIPKIFNDANGVANITRTGNTPDYRLTISAAGAITCDLGANPNTICTLIKLGY